MAKISTTINGICHVYNRGVDKRQVFLDRTYYARFLDVVEHTLNFDWPFSRFIHRLENAENAEERCHVKTLLENYRCKPPVELISFCLMPNHYHFVFKQLVKDGVSKFMQRVGIAFTKYFNIRNERTGSLFESGFKSVPVETEKQLVYVVRYQHVNPFSLGLKSPEELLDYKWSSLSTYVSKGKPRYPFVTPELPLASFNSKKAFLDFTFAEFLKHERLGLEEIAIDDDFNWFIEIREYAESRKRELREKFLNVEFN